MWRQTDYEQDVVNIFDIKFANMQISVAQSVEPFFETAGTSEEGNLRLTQS